MAKRATSSKAAKKPTATKIPAKKRAPKRTAKPGTRVTTKNLDIYGAPPLEWPRALEQLEAGPAGTFWLATTSPDGRPHLAGIGALWVEGKIYIVTGAGTRKGRDLSANPSCALSVSLKGIDLVIEGRATRVTDRPTLARLAERYAAQGWPATVRGKSFTAPYSAPSAGPPPWDLYVITPTTAFGVGASEDVPGASRWRFK